MNKWLWRLSVFSPALQRVLLLLVVSFTLSLSCLLGLQPARLKNAQLLQNNKQLARQYQKMMISLAHQPAIYELENKIMQQEAQWQSENTFSLLALLNSSGAELEHWRPLRKQCELTLRLAWPQLLSTFDYLAGQRSGIALAVFSLDREQHQLKLYLMLGECNEE